MFTTCNPSVEDVNVHISAPPTLVPLCCILYHCCRLKHAALWHLRFCNYPSGGLCLSGACLRSSPGWKVKVLQTLGKAVSPSNRKLYRHSTQKLLTVSENVDILCCPYPNWFLLTLDIWLVTPMTVVLNWYCYRTQIFTWDFNRDIYVYFFT